MCYKKFGERFDCVSSQERSDSAYYKFCNLIDNVEVKLQAKLGSKTSGKTLVNFYLVPL